MKASRVGLATGLALSGVIVLLCGLPVSAQSVGTVEIQIAPSEPSEDDNISITASGEWPSSCVPANPQVSIEGSVIRIATSSPGQLCLAVISSWSVTVDVGQLSAGSHHVIVTNEAFSSPPRVIGEADFIVAEGQDTILDHFKCYRVQGQAPRRSVILHDQFERESGATVLQPVLLCAPVDKNGEGISDPANHLTCYETKSPARQPKFGRRTVIVENQFGQQSMEVVSRANLLCVPSRKAVVATCGSIAGLMCQGTQACDLRDATCSITDLAGTCVPRPGVCAQIHDPVCGCDGVTYSNDCERLRAEAVLAHPGPCAP